MILFFYNFLTLIISILLGPVFLLVQRGRLALQERYGFWKVPESDGEFIWLHVASLGELNGCRNLIEYLKQKYPQYKIIITTTSTSAHKAIKDISENAFFIPFDNYFLLRNAVGKIKIQAFIFCETEIWPALMGFLAGRNIPAYHVNARISDFTWQQYKILKSLFRPCIRFSKKIFAATEKDKRRFLHLGAREEDVLVSGNMKYDNNKSVSDSEQPVFGEYLEGNLPLLVLGSIRPDEEKIWFPAIEKAIKSGLKLNVIVAPRHKEKFEYFKNAMRDFNFICWSQKETFKGDKANFILLDTFGDLERAYSEASLAFIGATIKDFGGHNPLEAAAYSVPLALGPHRGNIADITDSLESRGAIFNIESADDAFSAISAMCDSKEKLKVMGLAAFAVWEQNIGATEKVTKEIKIS